jgi:hypothetical protein
MTKGTLRATALRWWTRLEHLLRTSESFTVRQKARRVFFPGCSLSGTDPQLTLRVLDHLRRSDPGIGLWSECCGSPLAKIGGGQETGPSREALANRLREAGVQEVITACGNCAASLAAVGRSVPGLRVSSLYGVLADSQLPTLRETVPLIVHHPCPARTQPELRDAFFSLTDRTGLVVLNREQPGHALPCCLAKGPAARRRRLAMAARETVTYCAHCTTSFQRDVPIRHVLQLLFSNDERWQDRGKLARFDGYLELKSGAATRLPSRTPNHLTAVRSTGTESDP